MPKANALTFELLEAFQYQLFLQSWTDVPAELLEEEEGFIKVFTGIPECDADREFLEQRLERFANVTSTRICSTLDLRGVKRVIAAGRQTRAEYQA